ncbi:unnamed protein product [Paramecium octaurelia]|uniref:Uncharacterized protein n=1 Tax=Paramecium octaurelia TaxID=43137 RepID=A0A8S1UCP0_PAROT|nr:unnamed protein product [Paramecium octaurelia]
MESIKQAKQQLQDKELNNNRTMRSISDKIDDFFGWQHNYKQDSLVRGIIHGCYHGMWGVFKYMASNTVGSQREFKRAKDQFQRNGRARE